MASVTKLVESFSVFEPLDDPRAANCLHPLLSLIAIAVCATVAGCDNYADIERFAHLRRLWFAEFLDLRRGIPSHDTFSRVFARLDTAQFFLCVQRWLAAVGEPLEGQTVAIDGKTLRGSFDTAAGRSPLHLVSAWACGQRLLLGQIAVDHKSNEITAVPQLLELLELRGAVVTLDALHCQRETAQALVAREADYVITLKDNQPALLADVSITSSTWANATTRRPRSSVTGRRKRDTVAWMPRILCLSAARAAAAQTSLARAADDRHGVSRTDTGRPGANRDQLLHQQFAGQSPPAGRARPDTLGHREPPALESGCNFFRGSLADPQRRRSGNHRHATTFGALDFATGHDPQREPPRQTLDGRLG